MKKAKCKLLLVEDDFIDQLAFKRIVDQQMIDYEYVIADSVSSAKNIFQNHKFDIVITDYQLGDGTAFDIFKFVEKTPVIFTTGAGNEEIAIKAMKAGAYDYLIKDKERNYLKILPLTVENTIKYHSAEIQSQMLSQAITSTRDSVFITNLENDIIFVNRAFCETYQYTEEEIIGKSASQISNDENFESVFHDKNLQNQKETYHVRKSGTKFPVSVTESLIKDENGKNISVVRAVRDITERKKAENEREKLITKLKKALEEVNTLSGLLPMCASCKKIRDDDGYWKQVEAYIQDHVDVEISHGICPDCMKKLYPSVIEKLKK